jgi:GTPase involved in cell partitioning and DNA repair
MEVLANKENKSMPRDPQDNKFIQCMSNFQDKSYHAEEALHGDGAKAAAARCEDVEVNIIDCTTVSDNEQNEARCDDAVTESISSFGDTESKTKNGSSGLSDTEVESQLFVGGGQMSIFDGYGGSFKMRYLLV